MVLVFFLMLGVIAVGDAAAQTDPIIAGGLWHTAGLKSDGTVWAWGANASGQLGDGTGIDKLTPVQVGGLSNVIAVAAGSFHTLALKSDGKVWAWGQNTYGQTGGKSTMDKLTPVQVSGLSGVVAIAAGEYHSLALKSDNTVLAWGATIMGSLVMEQKEIELLRCR